MNMHKDFACEIMQQDVEHLMIELMSYITVLDRPATYAVDPQLVTMHVRHFYGTSTDAIHSILAEAYRLGLEAGKQMRP